MAISPHSTLYLCRVNFNSSYNHVVYTSTKEVQKNYFLDKVQYTFSDYSYNRKDSILRVGKHIDKIINCNYVMYQNSNYSNKWFYAFIEKMEYVNDNVTLLYIKTDVYQTWIHDVTFLESFVVREHSAIDSIGDNIVPENFEIGDMKLQDITYYFDDVSLTNLGYLVASSEMLGASGSRGRMHSGIYQGLYFYYFDNINNMNECLDALENESGNCIVSISCIPQFSVSSTVIGDNGYLYYSDSPASLTKSHVKPPFVSIDNYVPKNNKCFTSQFYSLYVTNNNGNSVTYNIEDWKDEITFTFYGDISLNPTLVCVPSFYKGIDYNFNESLNIDSFPQCAFNSDTYKLWLAKNQYSLGGQMLTNTAGGLMQVATGNPVGILNISTSICNTLNEMYSHSKEPNKAHIGKTNNNLLTALKKNTFSFFLKYPKFEIIKSIDDYFTQFGYATNKLKVPNRNVRESYTYTQTIDCNIRGNIPDEDMKELKAIFDNGVTLWNSEKIIGDYSQSNKVI